MNTFGQEDDFRGKLDLRLWAEVFKHALRHRRFLWPLAGAAVLIAAIDASFALVTKYAIDGVLENPEGFSLVGVAALYSLLVLGMSAGVWLFIEMAGSISNHVSHDIRRACFHRLQEMEFAFFDVRPVGWLITRLTSDCDRLARIIAWGFLDLLWGSCLLVMISVILLVLDFRLGLLILAVVPPLVVLSIYFQRKILLSAREVRRLNSKITATYNEGISGVRTTKTLVREDADLAEFQGQSGAMFAASVLNARQSALYYPLVMTLGSVAAGIALWYGGVSVLAGAMTLGTLVAFLNYAGQFFNPINQMARILTEMQGAQAAGERVLSLLRAEPAIFDRPEVTERVRRAAAAGLPPGAAPDGREADIDTIEFNSVRFAYTGGPAVLHDFNLTVTRGQTIALVGPSGSGKTTVVGLLARFYEPTQGRVLVNGTDYRERPLEWYQSNLGVVLQTPHLFRGTVRDNIRYGRHGASDAEVEEAARLVNADGFIAQLENGYDTDIGEGGNRLSTGQRQLLSFARAILADPRILIMDEATSSIDTETEALIQAGLRRVLAGRISFVIAHRLSTIRSADRILVMNAGRIEESGRHEELLRQRGHYYSLYTRQFRRESEDAALDATTPL
ncbi:MAG: ABC transporter ATP-binding protein [Puniceicoccaceae bacterium]|nr:MAG: ABC transporter ATP-binding protein [Puniceicoccaceae bacterium]